MEEVWFTVTRVSKWKRSTQDGKYRLFKKRQVLRDSVLLEDEKKVTHTRVDQVIYGSRPMVVHVV